MAVNSDNYYGRHMRFDVFAYKPDLSRYVLNTKLELVPKRELANRTQWQKVLDWFNGTYDKQVVADKILEKYEQDPDFLKNRNIRQAHINLDGLVRRLRKGQSWWCFNKIDSSVFDRLESLNSHVELTVNNMDLKRNVFCFSPKPTRAVARCFDWHVEVLS